MEKDYSIKKNCIRKVISFFFLIKYTNEIEIDWSLLILNFWVIVSINQRVSFHGKSVWKSCQQRVSPTLGRGGLLQTCQWVEIQVQIQESWSRWKEIDVLITPAIVFSSIIAKNYILLLMASLLKPFFFFSLQACHEWLITPARRHSILSIKPDQNICLCVKFEDSETIRVVCTDNFNTQRRIVRNRDIT